MKKLILLLGVVFFIVPEPKADEAGGEDKYSEVTQVTITEEFYLPLEPPFEHVCEVFVQTIKDYVCLGKGTLTCEGEWGMKFEDNGYAICP